ncbi:MAG: hypothetical protein HWE15_05490 [Algoriphagus sp.]|uniref:hypothetical protein n=1 Tax=Algoriphagus sp. TaxID=1872435 RepID=UPI0017EE218B|nr:hypothetical protein [Algoriphagus sp.]NVJ85738.1 hypothetical protein [Algoriphagus sp.]
MIKNYRQQSAHRPKRLNVAKPHVPNAGANGPINSCPTVSLWNQAKKNNPNQKDSVFDLL